MSEIGQTRRDPEWALTQAVLANRRSDHDDALCWLAVAALDLFHLATPDQRESARQRLRESLETEQRRRGAHPPKNDKPRSI